MNNSLKTNHLLHTAADRASGPTTKVNPKPESKPRIAAAEGRVKPLARLLRCATALRVTAPLGCGLGGWYGRKVPFRPLHTAPSKPDNQDDPPPFPRIRVAPTFVLKYNIRPRSLADPGTIEDVLAVENDVVPFDRADVLGAGLRPGLPW